MSSKADTSTSLFNRSADDNRSLALEETGECIIMTQRYASRRYTKNTHEDDCILLALRKPQCKDVCNTIVKHTNRRPESVGNEDRHKAVNLLHMIAISLETSRRTAERCYPLEPVS
jgi:hypothetical protein